MTERARIEDQGDLHRYRTELPNMIDDMNLTPYAYRLYGRLKRVAGDEGSCWQSTRTLAEGCNMSAGMVSKAKAELVERGLITVKSEKNKDGGLSYHVISIVDVWPENNRRYAGKRVTSSPHELTSSYSEQASSPHELTSSPHETKKNPLRRTLEEEPLKKGENPPPAFSNLSVAQIKAIPEIAVYMQVTGRYPGTAALPIIYRVVREHGFTVDQLQPFWEAWIIAGYRVDALPWLTEWATSGAIPVRGAKQQANEPDFMDLFRREESKHELS